MHGMIFGELKKLVDTKLGGDSWNELLADAGLGSRIYMPVGEYSDQEMMALVEAVSRRTALDARAVAIGIVRGVAAYYQEVVEIKEFNCMSLGASACRILVRR